MKLIVWVADVGSVKQKNFGWCRDDGESPRSGRDIQEFADGIGKDISEGYAVALGFECPLFVPIAAKSEDLNNARPGEGNRAWCAGAGAGALATGLVECVWIFERIRAAVTLPPSPTFDWQVFADGGANLFVWEALVTGSAKGQTDDQDAEIAARAFRQCLETTGLVSHVTAAQPYSLAGAGLLRSRLSSDLRLLFEPCVVITARAH